ncbi:ROK family transcriptional regulator [Glycomyces xiaoerkulensis]|uniref:ROK family transcriptional regulator n=1 Tax=Glycomyces xiaoerkulensis TaxID=2038139 RepID=UPI0018E43CA7|nr:ROK family transcriptional regulator [Glycomyces xiaoerkulensis]
MAMRIAAKAAGRGGGAELGPGRPRRADFTDVRANNLGYVLRQVRAEGRCSRADLAAKTGLNKATVSSLVAELIERRVLRESGSVIGNIGRPAVLLSVDTGYYASLGVEVNVDYMTLVAVDLEGNRLLSWRRAHDGAGSTPGKSVSALAGLAKRAVDKMDSEGRQILGLAVAVPGAIDHKGVVEDAPRLGWSDFDLTSRLRRAMRDPEYAVLVDNDANLGAVAEHRFGSHAGVADMLYLTGEIGLGSGLIVDGELRRGAGGFAGEIGNLLIEVDGRTGQVDDLASIRAVLAAIAEADRIAGTEVEAEVEDVVTRARAGDEAVIAVLERVGRALGAGLSCAVDLLNPEVVVLGGHFPALSHWLVPTTEAELHARAHPASAGNARIVVSDLGHEAPALGAATGILNDIDAGLMPTPLGS